MGNTHLKALGASTAGWTSNLGITLAAGVFTITGHDGTALGAQNPGYVTCNSTTAGQLVTLQFTAPATWTDESGTPTYANDMGFGVTTTANWAEDVPFFLYVVNEDDTDANAGFFFSRSPSLSVTPAAGLIHDTDALGATADSQDHIAGIWADDAGKAAKPCVLIGAFRMQYDTTSDGWTVQTLGNTDGIGPDAIRKTLATSWAMPLAQNGASAGTFIKPNGGTAPVFTTNDYEYTLSSSGWVDLEIALNGDGGTDGSGAVTTQVAIPYASNSNTSIATAVGSAYVQYVGQEQITIPFISSGNTHFTMDNAAVTTGQEDDDSRTVTNSFFTNGARFIKGHIRYKAF